MYRNLELTEEFRMEMNLRVVRMYVVFRDMELDDMEKRKDPRNKPRSLQKTTVSQ